MSVSALARGWEAMGITMTAARRLLLPSCGAMSLDLSLSFSRYISSGLREERDTFGPIHVPEDRFFRRLLCSCALCLSVSLSLSLSLSLFCPAFFSSAAAMAVSSRLSGRT